MDVALLPIGQKFTMGIDEAIKAAKTINPKIVIPMHVHETNPKEFKRKLEACSNIRVIALRIGEIYQVT